MHGRSDMALVSVTSSCSALHGRPVRASVRMTIGSNASVSSWRGERLTETRNPGIASAQRLASVHAIARTRSPRASISPVSSATAMKTSGATLPALGWVQRASASTPMIAPSPSDTIGW